MRSWCRRWNCITRTQPEFKTVHGKVGTSFNSTYALKAMSCIQLYLPIVFEPQLNCCGIFNYQDWIHIESNESEVLPRSCCQSTTIVSQIWRLRHKQVLLFIAVWVGGCPHNSEYLAGGLQHADVWSFQWCWPCRPDCCNFGHHCRGRSNPYHFPEIGRASCRERV